MQISLLARFTLTALHAVLRCCCWAWEEVCRSSRSERRRKEMKRKVFFFFFANRPRRLTMLMTGPTPRAILMQNENQPEMKRAEICFHKFNNNNTDRSQKLPALGESVGWCCCASVNIVCLDLPRIQRREGLPYLESWMHYYATSDCSSKLSSNQSNAHSWAFQFVPLTSIARSHRYIYFSICKLSVINKKIKFIFNFFFFSFIARTDSLMIANDQDLLYALVNRFVSLSLKIHT